MDPFAILPIELAQMVALYLPFKNMVNYIRVSKGWKTFLTRNPKLWLDLDLSRARKDVSRVFIRNAVKYSDYKIRSLTVYRFNHSDVLRNVATVCKELEELTFCAGSTWSETLIETTQLSMNLKKLVVKSEVTWNTVYNILRTRPTLEHVEFHAIQWSPEAHRLFQTNTYSLPPQPKLRTLHLQVLQERGQTRHRDFGDFRNFFQESHTPKLETLILRHWDMGRGEADLRDVPLKNVILNMSGVVPRLPESLERLELKLSFLTGGWTAWNDLDRVRQYLPNLKHLSLEDLRGLPATIIDNLLKANIDDFGPSQHEIDNLAHLESLAIRDSHMDDDQRKLFKDSPEERALLTSPPRILTKSLQIL